ncbi:hypothetical protein F5Y19DRAFT_377383 [Xylariaceae sp. FL1651]|nr:hypothetical protein F5Y19DRAFT_377383 [Xylariaceae sp. FL1651]
MGPRPCSSRGYWSSPPGQPGDKSGCGWQQYHADTARRRGVPEAAWLASQSSQSPAIQESKTILAPGPPLSGLWLARPDCQGQKGPISPNAGLAGLIIPWSNARRAHLEHTSAWHGCRSLCLLGAHPAGHGPVRRSVDAGDTTFRRRIVVKFAVVHLHQPPFLRTVIIGGGMRGDMMRTIDRNLRAWQDGMATQSLITETPRNK